MKSLLIILLLCAVLTSCKETASTTSSGELLTGELVGYVNLLDSVNGSRINNSGVTVSFDGTSFSATTDSSGRWIVHNLPSRTYAMTFSKPGYITFHEQSYAFLGGGITLYGTTILRPPPSFHLAFGAVTMPWQQYNDSAKKIVYHDGSGYLSFEGTMPGPTYLGVLLIGGRTSKVDITDPTSYTYFSSDNNRVYQNVTTTSPVNITLKLYSLATSIFTGFKAGDTIYFRAYPYISYLGGYTDILTGKTIYYGYGEGSNVLSAVVQ